MKQELENLSINERLCIHDPIEAKEKNKRIEVCVACWIEKCKDGSFKVMGNKNLRIKYYKSIDMAIAYAMDCLIANEYEIRVIDLRK